MTVWNALDARAWAAKHLGTPTGRTLDQLRAEALVDLCAESLDKSLQGKYVVPDDRKPTEAALARLAAVIRRRCVISVHVSADVLLGQSDTAV